MYETRQTLHTGLTSSELQELLDDNCRVVYLHRGSGGDLWDAVLEKTTGGPPPEAIVIDFLQHVDVSKLETKMLEGGMGESPGTMAVKALMDMVAVPSGP